MADDDQWVDYQPAQAPADQWVDYAPPQAQARAPAQDEWVDYRPQQQPPPQELVPEAEGKLATAGRELAHGVVPGAAGAWAGMAAGAALGSAVPGLGTLAGGIIGGLGGGLLGGYAASTVQESALNALGFDDSLQRAVNAKENPWSSAGGAALSAVAGGGPGALTRAAAPGVAAITGKQALGIRAASGAIGGGFEAGSQLAQGEELDPARIAATAAGGAVFAKPYGWGNRAGEVGENIGARWRDRPRAQPHGAAGPDANASTAAEPPPVSKREDVGDAHNPMGEGSEVEYMKPRDSATGDNVGTHVIPPGEIDPTLKTALAAENAKAEPAPPPEAPTPPPEAAAPPPVAEPPQGVTAGPPVTPVAEPPQAPRVTVDPATGQMQMPKPKLTKAEQAAVDIDANAKARVMAREGQKSFPKEPTPEMSPVSRETMELANQIEATGRPDATAFADSMRGAAHNNRVRPEAIDFYKQKLTDFQARAGEAAAGTKPVEAYSIRDMLEPKQLTELDAHMANRSTPEKTALSDILQEAHVRSSELTKQINEAGWKVNDVVGGGKEVPPEIKAARQELSMLGGQVARLLGGLKPRKGRDVGARMGADMATLRKDLDAGKITPERQAAPEQTTLKPPADDLEIPSFLDRRAKPARPPADDAALREAGFTDSEIRAGVSDKQRQLVAEGHSYIGGDLRKVTQADVDRLKQGADEASVRRMAVVAERALARSEGREPPPLSHDKKEVIGVKEGEHGSWRVTHDGKVLGDSRGYSRADALAEAQRKVDRDTGFYALDPTLSAKPGETVSPALKNARRLNAEGGPTYPHASLARPKLEALIKAADEESSRINQAMIDAGRGHERPTDIRDMTDQLSMDKKAISEWQRGLNEEMRRRLKGHGKRTPLPKEYRDTFYAGESLRQDVIERGRSGRPIRTERLPIGSEGKILERGAQFADIGSRTFYHGTKHSFDKFRDRAGREKGGAFYFTESPRIAGNYATIEGDVGSNIRPVKLDLKNPKIIKDNSPEYERYASMNPELVAELKAQGHDGIIMERARDFHRPGKGDMKGDITEAIVLSNDQIRPKYGPPREPDMLAARRKPPKGPDEPDAAIDAAAAKATEAIDRATANKVANQLGARVKKANELGVTPESLKAHADAILKGTDPPSLSPITTRGWVKGEPLPSSATPSAARGTPSVVNAVGAGGGGPNAGGAGGGGGGLPPNVGAAAAAGAGGGGGPTTPNMGHTPPQQQSWLKELWRDVKRKTAAHTLGPEAMEARYLIRSSSGEKHRLAEQTIDLIRGHKDHIDSMSPADHAALIDHAQGGNHFPNFQPTAEQKLYLRDRERSMQEWEAVLHQLPAADQMQFREKYMAQMYENPQAAGGRVFTGMGKRGSAGSTKQRKYDTYMDAEAAGLIRKYNNPIEIDSRYINSIKDFVISRDVVQRGADAGIIQWFDNPKIVGASGSPEPKVTGGPPPGMKELNGVPMKGNSKTAYAPDDFADVYNNFYDKGFGTTPEKATVVEAVRNSANAWTSLELGLNAYHLFTMANEAVITDLTKGFNNILVGQVRKGLKQIAMSPLAPETMRREGKIFQKEYLDPNSTNPIAMILAEANARPIGRGHAADYTFQERGAFINKLSNIEGQLKQARKEIGEDFNKAFGPNATESKILFPIRQAGRILQTTAAPIFDKYIPMLKAGAVHSQFKDWHEAMVAKNPAFDMVNNPADRRTAVNAGMKIVDSVDNRFGEAIHDNAFMNGMLKQGLMTMMRSYSWTVGAMKEIGGGSAAAGQALYTLGKTRGAENRFDMTHKDWDPRMAYPLALMFAVSTISTIYQMLRAGEAPESWRDLYAPKTGGTVPGVGGKGMVKEHVLMPGYQKDVLGWAMHPAQEAYNKMGGLPTTAIEQLTGKDWRGDPIVRADANALEGFGQRLGHVLGKLSPISVKNMTKGSEPTSAITWPEKAIGFRAPGAHIQDPAGLKRAMDFKDRRIQKAIDKRERKIQLRQNPQVSP